MARGRGVLGGACAVRLTFTNSAPPPQWPPEVASVTHHRCVQVHSRRFSIAQAKEAPKLVKLEPGCSCNSGQLQAVPWARGELFGGRAAGRPAKLPFVPHKFPHLPPLPMAHRPRPSKIGQLAILRDEVTRFENVCRQHLVPMPAVQPRRVGGCFPVSRSARGAGRRLSAGWWSARTIRRAKNRVLSN